MHEYSINLRIKFNHFKIWSFNYLILLSLNYFIDLNYYN